MDPVQDLQYAIEWYQTVVPPDPRAPASVAPDSSEIAPVIHEIRRELFPLELPPEISWFWSTWGNHALDFALDVLPWPRLTSATFALQTWRDQRDGEFPGLPRSLFPVAYESHGFLLADITAAGDGRPAPLWLYAYDFDAFQLQHPSLAGLFRSVAATLESSGITVPADRARWDLPAVLDGDGFDSTRRSMLAAADLGPQPTVISVHDQRRWPEPWQRASGFLPDDAATFGATHTVAELIAAAAAGAPFTARLRGTCQGYVGPTQIRGEWFGIRSFRDQTGTINVLEPSSLRPVGPGAGSVEITVECVGPFGYATGGATGACELAEASAANDADRMTSAVESLFATSYPDLEHYPRVRRMVGLD